MQKQLGSRFSPTRVLTLTTCFLAMAGVKSSAGQSPTPSTAQKKSNFTTTTDVSLGVFGQLTPTRIPTSTTTDAIGTYVQQTTQGTSASAGVLGVVHQQFRPWLGYNANFGYSRFTENYSMGASSIPTAPIHPVGLFSQGSIGTNMYELSVASVVQGPHTKRFSTFAQLGGGVLSFLPTQRPGPTSVDFRALMVFGTGVNYKLSQRLGVRAEYRGLFYKSPDFQAQNSGVPVSKLFTVTNAPTVSIVYSFGSGSKREKANAVVH